MSSTLSPNTTIPYSVCEAKHKLIYKVIGAIAFALLPICCTIYTTHAESTGAIDKEVKTQVTNIAVLTSKLDTIQKSVDDLKIKSDNAIKTDQELLLINKEILKAVKGD